MGILFNKNNHFEEEQKDSLVSLKSVVSILSRDNEFIEDILKAFSINSTDDEVMRSPVLVGNLKYLLEDIKALDDQDLKIDIKTRLQDIDLDKVQEHERTIFHIYGITDEELKRQIKADNLEVECFYSAKSDVLDCYSYSKFASFLHENSRDAYANEIWREMRDSLIDNKVYSARLLLNKEEKKYYLRAVTSESGYKNYGINFSVLVALLAIDAYARKNQDTVFIDGYSVDDSRITLSFQFSQKVPVNDKMSLSLSLLLENDEIRQSAVSFNAIFKVNYGEERTIYLKPVYYKKKDGMYSTDMLTYTHHMNVPAVYDRVQKLPDLIKKYTEQVREKAPEILNIREPLLMRDYIAGVAHRMTKDELKGYKDVIVKKLMSMQTNNIINLFDVLKDVEELFKDDIKSLNFWREKLYLALIERGKRDRV